MERKPRPGVILSCRGKRGYPTWTDANQVSRHGRRMTRTVLVPYRCRFCNLWHVSGVQPW